MAFLDHEGSADYPYPRDVVLEALLAAIPMVPGMKVHSVDKVAGRVLAKAGWSIQSWGENIPISVSEIGLGQSRISITSTPKTGVMFGGALDLGKNRANIERILKALSDRLSALKLAPTPNHPKETPRGDPAQRLAKLKALLDDGLITNAEFERRKTEILSEI